MSKSKEELIEEKIKNEKEIEILEHRNSDLRIASNISPKATGQNVLTVFVKKAVRLKVFVPKQRI